MRRHSKRHEDSLAYQGESVRDGGCLSLCAVARARDCNVGQDIREERARCHRFENRCGELIKTPPDFFSCSTRPTRSCLSTTRCAKQTRFSWASPLLPRLRASLPYTGRRWYAKR